MVIKRRNSVGQSTWEDFMRFVDVRRNTSWMFRGVGNSEHELRPKVGWDDFEYFVSEELMIFKSFKRNAGLHLARECKTDWEWLALAQHHGLPTRLMDWTNNPLVAAFFAATKHEGVLKEAAVYALKITRDMLITPAERKAGPFEIKRVGFISPSVASARMASQKGVFTVHHQPNEHWAAPDLEMNTFIIPARAARYFCGKLFSLGIDHAHIFPDIDGLCQTLTWQYKNGKVDKDLVY